MRPFIAPIGLFLVAIALIFWAVGERIHDGGLRAIPPTPTARVIAGPTQMVYVTPAPTPLPTEGRRWPTATVVPYATEVPTPISLARETGGREETG